MTVIINTECTSPSGDEISTVKSPVSPISKLKREADFFQNAWEDVAPFLMSKGDELVASWGFERIGQPTVETVFLIHRLTQTNDPNTITVELPTSIHDFLPRQIFPPGHNDTIIRPHEPIHINFEATAITPLIEILYLIQCFLPGVIPIPSSAAQADLYGEGEKIGRALPEVKWLLSKEMILREAFGCTYFRYLVDAAREH